MLADLKKGRIFAPVINNEITRLINKKSRCCSSVWLECLPVTQEVASSSLVSTAKASQSRGFFYFLSLIRVKLHVSLEMSCVEKALFQNNSPIFEINEDAFEIGAGLMSC